MSNEIDDKAADAIWTMRCKTLHDAWVQVRYHKKRQRFFDLIDKITKSATVLLGASLLGEWLKDYLPWIGGIISSLGFLALIFGYGDRKQSHKDFAEQATNLVAGIELVPAGQLTPAIVAGFKADYARLCAKAPPPLKTLTIICEHEQSTASGYPNHVKLPSLYRRAVADFKN
jgi:hypothetical protein